MPDPQITYSASDISTVQAEIKRYMSFMYNSMMDGDNVFSSSGPFAVLKNITKTDASAPTTTELQASIFTNILSYTDFNATYGTFNTAITPSNVMNKSGSNYINTTSFSGITTDSNLLNASRYLAASSDSKQNTKLLDTLDELYIAYQLTDPTTYNYFVNDPRGMVHPSYGHTIYSYRLKQVGSTADYVPHIVNDPAIFDGTSANTAGKTLAYYKGLPLVNYIYTLDPKVVDIFVLRRLILGTFYAAHCRLFIAKYIESYTPAVAADPTATPPVAARSESRDENAGYCVTHFYNKLKKLNTDYDNGIGATEGRTLMATLQANMEEYNKKMVQIDEIDVDIRDGKKELKSNLIVMDQRAQNAAAAAKYKIAAISVAAIGVVAMLTVVALPLDMRVKMQATAAILALSLGLALLLNYFRHRAVADLAAEGFGDFAEGFLNIAGGMSYDTALDKISSQQDFKNMFDLVVLSQLNDMYANTIQMAFALRNNTLYNTLNYNQEKELIYFKDSAYRLDQAVHGADAIGNLYAGRTHVSTAVFRFFIQALFVIAITLVIIMLTEEQPMIRNVGLVVMGFVALVIVLMFIRALLTRVRTDAVKMYWGQPTGVLKGL